MMRFGIKAKQVVGVTLIVALAIATLTAIYLGLMVRVWLKETQAPGELVAKAAFQRAFAVAAEDTTGDLAAALRNDSGLRSILEASMYSKSVTFAAITDARGNIITHSDPDPALVGTWLAVGSPLKDLIEAGAVRQLRAIYARGGENYDVDQQLLFAGGTVFGAIHVGVSTLLIRDQMDEAIGALLWPILWVLTATVLVAMILANVVLRPISVISSGVARLGRGEFDAAVDLPDDAELRDVSESIKAIGLRLAAGGDATHRDARRLVALSRLSAGIAHEIKNPLNAMSIHLELLRTQLGGSREATEHLAVITGQLRRLDDVVQTFLKFSRPEQLTLRPTSLLTLLNDIGHVAEAEGETAGVRVEIDCPADLPDVRADASSLQNALLNLALNGCQAMPNGGTLRIAAAGIPGGRVAVTVSDSGVGIPADQLDKIFNLYFTTKEGGSGIGLAMVYRTLQLHDGDITVESAPGRGTTFTVTLPAAPAEQSAR
jgi:signal transduction histidine kinase